MGIGMALLLTTLSSMTRSMPSGVTGHFKTSHSKVGVSTLLTPAQASV